MKQARLDQTDMLYALVKHPEYGQCVVAASDIAAGQVVIQEKPLVLIDYNKDSESASKAGKDAYKRKRAFMTLPRPGKASLVLSHAVDQQSDILNCIYAPKLSKSLRKTIAYKAADHGVSELRKRRALFPELAYRSDAELIDYYLLISANAHAFDEDSIALLAAGCKVTHSCLNPNVAVSTRPLRDSDNTGSDTVKHIALRNIKKGELLVGSYAKLTTYTTIERRKYLMDHKIFICMCDYCSGPDFTRGTICEECVDQEAESQYDVAPLSTMYRQTHDNEVLWKCSNCNSKASDADILARWLHDGLSYEQSIRKRLSAVETEHSSPRDQLNEAVDIYQRSLEVFRWRHTLTAAAALCILDAACKCIDASQSPEPAQLDRILQYMETLPALLERWFQTLGLSASDEMSSLYLLMIEQLMTLSTLYHNIIPRAMAIVQSLLLKVRPIIEARRTWQIGHALEEYYDEQLVILNDLVNGTEDVDQVGTEVSSIEE